MKNIVILTAAEIRHEFFRKKIASTSGINVLRTYCETGKQVFTTQNNAVTDLREKHLKARLQSENDFFSLYTSNTKDSSNPVFIESGSINDDKYVDEIAHLNPDIVAVYGSSILKAPLLALFENRILNVHLGLSPYYRGSATNYWPLVDDLPECVGATFMYIDEGIDTGEIIHQVRPEINFYDTPSSIGNRLIKQMTDVYAQLIINFDRVEQPEPVKFNTLKKFCRRKDYIEESVQKLYDNFAGGMIDRYLKRKPERDGLFPIVQNKSLIPFCSYESNNVPLCTAGR